MFLAVGLGFIVSIGRKKTTRGYFLGGKSLPWYVIAGTLYAGGLAFERMIGPFMHGSFADPHKQVVTGIIFFAVITGTYTIYGGLRSAAWTDFMQIIILGVGGVLVPILGLRAAGGITAMVHEYPQKFQVFLPVDHPRFPFTGVFTGFLTVGIWYTCTSQHMVQRVLAAKDEWNARMGVIGAGYLHIITPFFFVFPGVLAYKILGPNLKPADSAYLALVQKLVWPGLRGLILAAMAAALMSNLSAVLNSASTLVTIDFYKKLVRPNASDAEQVRFGQLAGAMILGASAAVAWYISLTPGIPLFVKVQNIFFFIAPPFSVIFCAGLLWRRANTAGALT